MTVHAAKGLEFPIVFVVNMNRGTGGPPKPIRVLTDGRGLPSVAVADFESDADVDASAREREETKRLLYVALTRARDRLYLSGVVKDGAFRPGNGSLAQVMPASYWRQFEEAAKPAAAAAVTQLGLEFAPDVEPRPADDFAPLEDGSPARGPVVRFLEGRTARSAAFEGRSPDGGRTAGTLAHRLFAVAGEDHDVDALVDVAGTADDRALIARGAELAIRLRRNPELSALLASGRAYYEVPFSTRVDERTILRGSIDCLVRTPDGRTTVVELKTGGRRPEHEAQLAIYVDAARAMFTADTVTGMLVYAE
jgi:ATP-dependent exoDNAse (exonuclease V) beta subunit